jgi:hypothetical protein
MANLENTIDSRNLGNELKKKNGNPRSLFGIVMTGLAGACIVITLIPLFAVLTYVIAQGISSLNLDLLTKLPPPPGLKGGGVANALLGTLIVVGLATAIAVPIGVLAAVYLSEFSNNNQSNVPNISAIPILTSKSLPTLDPTVNVKVLTPQEIRIKKIELLRRLSEIKMKGYNLTKEYDFNSSIEEMEYEYALLKSFADKRNGIKLYKSFLLNTVSLVEFANEKYDPFDFKLEGWSEHMSVEVDSWDDVLEELYEKYKTSGGNWPAELKLALLIVGSGAGYHFTKSQFSGLPSGMGAGSLLGKMMSDNKKPSQFMTPQEINLENQKKMMKEREMLMKQQQKDKIKSSSTSETEPSMFNLGNLFGQNTQQVNNNQPLNNNNQQMNNNTQQMNNNTKQMNNDQSYNIQHPTTQFNIPQVISKGNSRDIPEIRAPENVAEILSRIKNIQSQANINTTETQEENSSNNDRLLSDVTLSASDPKKRGRKPTKKPLISINT